MQQPKKNMDNAIDMQRAASPLAARPARAARPKVRFMTPAQLAPYKEQVWAINAALVDWSRAEFEADFHRAALYAVFFVGADVVGLATVMEQTFQVQGRQVFTIGLGRAVVRPDFRNQFLVQRALIFRWIKRFIRRPLQPIYIWGSCVSYKSYLAFAKVLRVVYPVAQTPTPSRHEQVMDLIGTTWYGQQYDPRTKTVRVPNFKVSDHQVIPTESDLQDPAIRFYCDAVPTAQDATYGLLTISPCIRSNFLPMVGSWVRNALRKSLGIGRRKG
jgi:hypothetical protein